MYRLPFIVVIWLLLAGTAPAQDAVLERLEASATVRVELGASGQTVRAERVTIREVGALMSTIAESDNVGGEITFDDLMVFNFKPYIVSAWVDGVGYHVKRKGQDFLNGTTVVVPVFEQTDDLDGLTITGMNVVVRLRESEFEFEYIVIVDNQSSPQRTVSAGALPIQLALPAGLGGIDVEVDNGPDPLSAELRSARGGLTGVATAIPPGQARITIKGSVPRAERVEFMVAANRPVAAWSLLAWPASLEVRSFDLEEDRSNSYPEFSRWLGEPLEPGAEVDVAVGLPAAGEAAPVFSGTVDEPEETPAPPPAAKRRIPWLTIISALILLGAFVLWRFRR